MAKREVDYRDFKDRQDRPERTGVSMREAKAWWTLSEQGLPEALTDILTTLRQRQSLLTTQRQLSARLYCNQNPASTWGVTASRTLSSSPASRGRLRYNVIKSVCDTVQAKIAKNHPDVMFLTNGGSYRLRRKAQKLSTFSRGVFDENRVDELMTAVCMDAELQGSGFVHPHEEFGRVRLERVMADEIWVDEIEAFTGQPRSLFRVKLVDRDQLLALHPDAAALIEHAEPATQDEIGASATSLPISDLVQVCEAWHLPSNPNAKAKSGDGVHVLALKNGTIFKEPWTRGYFPFVKLDWSRKPWGYFGIGLAEEIEPQQLEVNRILWTIQESQMAMGSFKIAVRAGSNVDPNHLNDEIGTLIYYTGDAPPAYLTPPSVSSEVYQHLQTTISAAYQQAGLSFASSTGQNPLGAGASGQALREMEYIETDRFQIFAQAYERAHVELARQCIDVARDIAARDGGYPTQAPGSGFLRTIDWKDIDLSGDEYVVRSFPVSSLPQTPAARMQTVAEMVQAGWVSPRQGRRLMRFPDLEQIQSLQDAVEERIHDALEQIIDDGAYIPPDGFLDLTLAKELVLEYYNLYASLDIEPERLDLLQQWSEHIDYLAKAAQAASAPPPQGAPVGAPQANPMPPPVSPLVGNVPAAAA